MIAINDFTCCGCGACVSVCPKKAIVMKPDENGFFYPHVEENKCVHCNLCENVCSYRSKLPPLSLKEAYAAVSVDTNVNESASGGVFASIAQAVLAKGGAVYGCSMKYENGRLWPRHICVTNQDNLSYLKGSKYVQSDLGNSYKNVQNQLKQGQIVLFSGTPCQIAGLKSYLQKDYENLFTIDIICHGVPSAKLFQEYIAFKERKLGANIISFCFRDKSQGWKLFGSLTLDDGNIIYFDPEESSYYQMFLNSYTYRENCYSCPYASDHRIGDITIGDFWGIEVVHPELLIENGGHLDHEQGISCLIVNNIHGKTLLKDYGNGVHRWNSTYENVAKYNHQLIMPSQYKSERNKVLQLSRDGYEKLDTWYRHRLQIIKIKRFIRAFIPRPMKKVVKKIIKGSAE